MFKIFQNAIFAETAFRRGYTFAAASDLSKRN